MDLFIDESGAGETFLPGSPPTFVLASNNLSVQAAEELKSKWFPDLGKEELKYNKVKGTQEALCLLQEMVLKQHTCVLYAINKPFILLIVLLDTWLGQATASLDLEFYREGKANRYAKSLYDSLRSELTPGQFRALMEPLEAMVERFDEQAYGSFWKTLSQFRGINGVAPILESENNVGIEFYKRIFDNSNQKTMLSVPLTALTRLVQAWQWKYPAEQFVIYHDKSRELVKLSSEWERRCTGAAVDPSAIQQAFLTAPLQVNVNQSSFVMESKNCVQIQISDMLAGAAADYLNAALEPKIYKFTEYHRDLFNTFLFLYFAGGVLPVELDLSRGGM